MSAKIDLANRDDTHTAEIEEEPLSAVQNPRRSAGIITRTFKRKPTRVNPMTAPVVLALLLISLTVPETSSPASHNAAIELILRRVAENEKKNRILEMSYVYEVTRTKMTLGKNSEVKETEALTFEVTPLETGDYRRLVKRNGQPLSEAETRKEQRRLEDSLRRPSRLSPSERARLDRRKAQQRRKEERLWDEVLKAFDFRLERRETQQNRAVLVFDVIPRPSYSPPDGHLKILKQIKGKVWIDEAELQISRADIEFVDDIKIGAGFLAKVNKGGTLKVWKRKVSDEVWFPSHSEVVLNGRIALLKGFSLKFVSEFSNYRKFEASVTLQPLASNE